MRKALSASLLAAAVATATVAATAAPADATGDAHRPRLTWRLTDTKVDNQFRGLAAVSADTAWVAGTKGTILRTTDGGRHWDDVSPPQASDLEFRDIEAFDASHAVALSIGEADASRVYTTDDAGQTWHLGFTNPEKAAFYDCMAFFDHRHGLAMSDPVDGRIRFITTDDGGHSWEVLPDKRSPRALEGEAAFAASGQCLVAADRHNGYLVTGGGATARILHTPDRGRTWSAHDTPIASGASAGIYAAAFRDARHGILVGGDYTKPDAGDRAAGYTRTGAAGVRLAPDAPGAYRSSAAYLTESIAITVGPTGSDISADGGRHWRPFDSGAFDAVQCARGFTCWASGPDGRIATLDVS